MPRFPLHAARLSELIQRIYPRELAGSWDNTGLLLESSFTRTTARPGQTKSRVLICIDLTTSVCEEALAIDACAHIIAYHPIIFSGLKSLTLANSQQRTLLRLAAAGISVYCPHTAIDAIEHGVNDMLIEAFSSRGHLGTSRVVEPCKVTVPGFECAGLGRTMVLRTPLELSKVVSCIKEHLNLKHVQLAIPPRARAENGMIRTIGICAGSGGSVLKSCDVDLIVTGELSHHEQLAFIERGVGLILCGHSNTERPFLPTMERQLQSLFDEAGESVEVIVSEEDVSPFETV